MAFSYSPFAVNCCDLIIIVYCIILLHLPVVLYVQFILQPFQLIVVFTSILYTTVLLYLTIVLFKQYMHISVLFYLNNYLTVVLFMKYIQQSILFPVYSYDVCCVQCSLVADNFWLCMEYMLYLVALSRSDIYTMVLFG